MVVVVVTGHAEQAARAFPSLSFGSLPSRPLSFPSSFEGLNLPPFPLLILLFSFCFRLRLMALTATAQSALPREPVWEEVIVPTLRKRMNFILYM